MTPDKKLEAYLNEMPPAPTPKGVYKPCLIVDNFVYVSGHGPYNPDGSMYVGRVGSEVDMDYAIAAARQTGLSILATLKAHLGNINRIKRVVKVLGMVNATSDFGEHPKVINGCSNLFLEIWGEENGVGVRSAVGMGSLPNNITVEIEAMFELGE